MRAVIIAFVSGVASVAVSAQAAPLAPNLLSPVTYIPNQEWAQLPNDPPGRLQKKSRFRKNGHEMGSMPELQSHEINGLRTCPSR